MDHLDIKCLWIFTTKYLDHVRNAKEDPLAFFNNLIGRLRPPDGYRSKLRLILFFSKAFSAQCLQFVYCKDMTFSRIYVHCDILLYLGFLIFEARDLKGKDNG